MAQITVTNKWVSNQVDFSWYIIFCMGHSKETINSCQSLIIQPFDFVVAWGELKPGSLPNLTNLEIGQAPGGGGGNTVNHSCNSSKTSTAGGPGTIAKDGQESPYSSVSIYSVLSTI